MIASSDFFDQIKAAMHSKTPFVLFTKPSQESVKAYVQCDKNSYVIEDFTESGFVFAPFNQGSKTYYIPADKSTFLELDKSEFEVSGLSAKPETSQTSTHADLVTKAIDEINSTDLQKVVLSRFIKVKLEEQNPLHIFKKLAAKYTTAFSYCWYHPQTGFWLGASPECLLKLNGRSLTTMALAGTQDLQKSPAVQWDDKNLNEHAFVTDYLLEVLSQYLEAVKTSGPNTLRAGHLLHLQTVVTGRLRPGKNALKQLIRTLHPTPAVCGTPRPLALDFINAHEAYDREYYTGFFGELNSPENTPFRNSKKNIENRAYRLNQFSTDLAVNLRCMKLMDTIAILYSGGGITKDSSPKDECTEIINKMHTVKSVL
jgi:isochorismate synthase